MRPSTEDLTRVYLEHGLKAAIQADFESGAPTKKAARDRVSRLPCYRHRRRNRPWRTEERELLVELWNQGVPARQIAARLDRTFEAVRRYTEHMPQCRRRCKRPWTDGHRRIVDRAVDQLVDHLALRLNRPKGGIRREVARAITQAGKRSRAASITDLGGMAQMNPPGPSRKAVA